MTFCTKIRSCALVTLLPPFQLAVLLKKCSGDHNTSNFCQHCSLYIAKSGLWMEAHISTWRTFFTEPLKHLRKSGVRNKTLDYLRGQLLIAWEGEGELHRKMPLCGCSDSRTIVFQHASLMWLSFLSTRKAEQNGRFLEIKHPLERDLRIPSPLWCSSAVGRLF